MKKIFFSGVAAIGIIVVGVMVASQIITSNAQVKQQNIKINTEIVPEVIATTTTEDRVIKLSATPEGLYVPSIIDVTLGTKIRIEGDPQTLVGGMDTVIIDGYGIQKKITPEDNVIEFIADKTGTFKVHCANGMGNGTLEVK